MKVELTEHNGKLMIAAGERLYAPMAFRSFRPDADNIQSFYKAGVRVMSLLVSGLNCSLDVPYSTFGETWVGEDEYRFAALDRQIALFREHAPEAKLMLMIHLDTRDWWLRAHSGAPSSFSHLGQIAGDEKWREDTAVYLEKIIAYAEERYPDTVLGYFLMGGKTTEWFSSEDRGEPHPIKEAAYRRYTGDNDIGIPDRVGRERTGLGVFRHPVEQREALRYWRFHHELIADTVLQFARRAKATTEGRKLVGVFFGYLLELGGERLLHAGHLAYERLLQSDAIDMYCAPSSYMHRSFQGASAFMNTIDSLLRRKKLFILEFDHITHQAPKQIEGKNIPGQDSKLANETHTLAVMRRDFAMIAAKQTGLWWFDMFGGWFDSEPMKQEVARMNEAAAQLAAIPMSSNAQIAVFADPDVMYAVDGRTDLNTDLLGRQRDGLGRMGAPYELYSLADAANDEFSLEQYRLLIFLNGFSVPPELKRRLELYADRISTLWIYAPGIIVEDGFSLTAASELTGMKLEWLDEPEQHAEVGIGSGRSIRYGFARSMFPMLAVADADATITGYYAESGRPAAAYRREGDAIHYFSGAGNLPGALLRDIARLAGVHLYAETDDPLYINNRLIGIHAQTGGSYTFRLPDERATEAEELLAAGQERRIPVGQGQLKVNIGAGETRLFLLHGKEFA